MKKIRRDGQLICLTISRVLRYVKDNKIKEALDEYFIIRDHLNYKKDVLFLDYMRDNILPINCKMNRTLYPELDKTTSCGRYLR